MLFFPRFLAAVLDYSIVWVGYETISSFLIPYLTHSMTTTITATITAPVTALLFGLCYYGVGNSEVFSGQTLGKRAFGVVVLRTKSTDSPTASTHLLLGQSFLRYFLSFGIFLLGIEIPDFLFRAWGVVASPYLLQAHMLVLLMYALSNLMSVILDPLNRTLYDKITSSVVMRKSTSLEGVIHTPSKQTVQQIIQGAMFGTAFWLIGTNYSESEMAVMRYRYAVEKEFPLRILSVKGLKDSLLIEISLVDDSKNRAKKEKVDKEKIAREIVSKLRESITPELLSKRIKIQIYESNQEDEKNRNSPLPNVPFGIEIDA